MTWVSLRRVPHEKPWGRTDLPDCFGQDSRKIGEVWYQHPECSLPLLIKWLFTSDRLSIQVHPNDQQAQAAGLKCGKEEWWMVVDAEPGACLGIGTKSELDPEELRTAVQDSSLGHLIDWRPVQSGDWFHITPGTVHAIGGGVTLIEIQQDSDVTYRLFDYGRPRELHLDQAIEVSEARPFKDTRQGSIRSGIMCGNGLLAACAHFEVFWGNGPKPNPDRRGVAWVIPVSGTMWTESEDFSSGLVAFGGFNGSERFSNDFGGLFAYAPDSAN